MSTIGGGWLTEGTAHRTPVQREPVIHLLVREGSDWTMWCSGGKGREDNPHGNRLCRSCRDLAWEAVRSGDLDKDEAGRWVEGMPTDAAEVQVSKTGLTPQHASGVDICNIVGCEVCRG